MKNLERKISRLPSLQNEALQEIIKGMYEGKPLLGPQGLLTRIAKDLIEMSLEAEMEVHLEDNSLENGANRRNGLTSKTMKASSGSFELEVPRDRNGSFEPQMVKKRQTIMVPEFRTTKGEK